MSGKFTYVLNVLYHKFRNIIIALIGRLCKVPKFTAYICNYGLYGKYVF